MNSSLAPRFSLLRDELTPRCLARDQEGEAHLLRLRLGHPLLPPHGCFTCGRHDSFLGQAFPSDCHYYCSTCDLQFHYLCHKLHREKTRHPYHPQHSLSFSSFRSSDETLVSHTNFCEYLELGQDVHNIHGRCDWCGDGLQGELLPFFYLCSLCGFGLCLRCSRKDPSLTITNTKTHPHTLTFFPRPLSTPCDACGLADAKDPAYACHRCNYVVHVSCLDLPRAIKLTRHPHRLSHSPFLSLAKWSCGVCHRRVDPRHGAYSCTRHGCSYAIHSKCATRKDVWDGKELEGVPEEEPEDIEPFVVIGENEILHFSHEEHSLHLVEDEGNVGYENVQCQACVLSFDGGSFYGCMPCGFFLHQECANLPRKKHHELHLHPLVLDPFPKLGFAPLSCSVCGRQLSGFIYRCSEPQCNIPFQVDVRCTSVYDPFIHKSHRHPLSIEFEYDHRISCGACGRKYLNYYLKCIEECDFVTCFGCATLPYEMRYKYDAHPITLCYGEDASGEYWCDECEARLDPTKWFYECAKCCITLHVSCVFGSSVYMKAGRSFNFCGNMVEIVKNNRSTRPICAQCGGRCQGTVLFKRVEQNGDVASFMCSLNCSFLYSFRVFPTRA